MDKEKIKLLKSLHLLDKIPEDRLADLGSFLRPKALVDGDVVFEEGSKGDSLFFVATGHVRISKRLAGGVGKDLAILGAGDCFGEMAMIEETPRSARATAVGQSVVFQLARKDLNRWLKSSPDLMMAFFAELVQVQSRRLRRTSNELALLSDLSALLLDTHGAAKDLLLKVLERVVPHLAGSWSAAAYLYNLYNDEMEFVARFGDFDLKAAGPKLPPHSETRNLWLDPTCYFVSLPGDKRPLGYLIFRSHANLSDEDKNEVGRTLTTVARLVTSSLENISFKNEEALRARLKASSYGSNI